MQIHHIRSGAVINRIVFRMNRHSGRISNLARDLIAKPSGFQTCMFPPFLQKMSFERGAQLNELQNIIAEITRELMWVNDREEEELMFDWGNKNIDVYVPKKQESYSVRRHKQPYIDTYS